MTLAATGGEVDLSARQRPYKRSHPTDKRPPGKQVEDEYRGQVFVRSTVGHQGRKEVQRKHSDKPYSADEQIHEHRLCVRDCPARCLRDSRPYPGYGYVA